ncbi:MAG: polysaccharide biosynthesis C-terminal domain-containing protein, partial [Clostridia bacterium]|nr:polysaccharide biosynthesis C-terminal domain-containing protein [Clostridia bacterium]
CIPLLGIDGAPVGTGICYLVIAVLNIISIIKVSGIEFKWSSFVIKPILAALIMGIAGLVMSRFLPISKLLCLVEIAICAVVYVAAIFAVKAVKKEDILTLPKGEKLARILEKYKLIK